MWSYIARRLLASIPVYLGIVFIVMAALRVHDPVYAYLGKYANQDQIDAKRHAMCLDKHFLVQYGEFLGNLGMGYQRLVLNFAIQSRAESGAVLAGEPNV